MNLFNLLGADHPVPHAVLILSLVAVGGLLLGRIQIKGIGLGIAGVMFAGIIFGHFGWEIDHGILEYSRDFGLVLFVYTIGMQVGPGFFQSLRKQGVVLNLMAIATVGLGAGIALLMGRFMNFPIPAVVGLFSGATTNTPSLGAAQEALKRLPHIGAAEAALPGLAYAAAYPFGIIGIIGTMLLLRWSFRIDPKKEASAFLKEQGMAKPLQRVSIQIKNPKWIGTKLGDIPFLDELNVVVSRVLASHSHQVSIATPATILHLDDVLLAVGQPDPVRHACELLGRTAPIDLMQERSAITFREIVVTRGEVIGRTLDELNLEQVHGVTISRIARRGHETAAQGDMELQFADKIRAVGVPERLDLLTAFLGNSSQELDHTRFIPVFLGIALGVVAGSIPLQIAGMPAPVSLGLAGGPLVVAIFLSWLGRVGPLVWYMPLSANLALREFGIILFLSCVGLKAGNRFVEILVHGDGLLWMAAASLITVVPLLVMGLVSRAILKQNFMTTCGVLAGTMTDPPALAFANNISDSDAPSVAYATVYPLTMLLRILVAQAIVLFFA